MGTAGRARPPTPQRQATGEPLIQRSDDNVDALKTRLASFHKQTQPVVDYYRAKGIYSSVDGSLPMDVVWNHLTTILGKFSHA